MGDSRLALRKTLRGRRRDLSRSARQLAESRAIGYLRRLPAYTRARHLAVYLAVDGELDLRLLVDDAQRRGKILYAPVLCGERLLFKTLDSDRPMTRNRFGIAEPAGGSAIDPRSLDLVLTPLVAFDLRGTRLGMGKGFYDRTFAFLRLRCAWQKPKLLGIGFGFQQVASLAAQPWDAPLWGAVTDQGYYDFSKETAR